jgi:hypothetical protein
VRLLSCERLPEVLGQIHNFRRLAKWELRTQDTTSARCLPTTHALVALILPTRRDNAWRSIAAGT